MASSSPPSELYANIQSALQCITSPSSPPSTIKQAQDALLQWEATNTDEYVISLMRLVGLTSDRVVETSTSSPSPTAAAATLRLIAVLTLKSAIVRRWKDRGRGRVGAPQVLLSDAVKTYIRQSLLNLVLAAGKVDNNTTQTVVFITNPNEISMQQVELVQDKPLQTNAASLISKIARMDLPLKFHELIPTLVGGMKCSRGIVLNLVIQQQQQQQQQLSVVADVSRQQKQIFQTILHNTIHCLEEILSEISTQRLLVDKKYRNSIAIQYLETIVECGLIPSLQAVDSLRRDYGGSNNASSVVGAGGGGGGEEFRIIQYATLTSKVVSHLMTSSFAKLVEDPTTTPLVDQTLTLIHSFLSTWLPNVLDHDNNNNNDTLHKPMKELLLVHCELIVELQDSVEFMRYVKPFLDLFHTSLVYIVSNKGYKNSKSSQYTIAILSFLSNVVGETTYVNPDSANELTAFFTPGVIQSLSSTLLLLFSIHIYPNKNDIGQDDNYDDDDDDNAAERVQWQDDPEGFYQYESQRSSDDDIGCASQNLFLSLVESSFTAKVVIPWLTELLTNVVSQRLAVELECGVSSMGQGVTWEKAIVSALPLGTSSTSTTMQGEDVVFELLLQWDAIFAAAGLVGSILESSPGFDFRSWFDSSLGPCLSLLLQSKSQQPTQLPILRRRIIWVLSCNANQLNVASPLNPMGMLVLALSSHNDICTRLTAVQAMEALLPQCEDSPSILQSIVEPTVPALYQLANECTELQSRIECLDLLSNLITYVSGSLSTLSNGVLNAIVAPLSTIWANSVDQNLLLKRNVLGILSCVASFVGPDQVTVLHPLALPLVDDGLSREENVFLVEEALRLWWVFLRLSKTYGPNLGKLYIRAAHLSRDLEHVKILMRITEHYIIIGQASFLNDHAVTIQTVLSNVIGEVRPLGTGYIFLPLEALLCTFPMEGGSLLHGCGVLQRFLEACACSYFEQDNCEPDRVIVLYLSALARIFLANPAMLKGGLLPVTLPSGNVFGEEELFALYLLKWQVGGNGAHGLLFQKLWALFLLSFYPPCQLASCSSIILGRSNDIFNILLYVLKNVHPDGTNVLSYEIGWDEEDDHVGSFDLYEVLHQNQRLQDVVVTTSFNDAVRTKMNGLANELGERYQEFMSTIGSDTLQHLEEALG